jgi:hypothetical protein
MKSSFDMQIFLLLDVHCYLNNSNYAKDLAQNQYPEASPWNPQFFSVHISHKHTKTVYCKPNSNNIQFLPKKKTQDAAFSDAAALRDATIRDAAFTDAGWIQGCYMFQPTRTDIQRTRL